MSEHYESLVVLFADMCESTRLYEVLGNDHARVLVGRSIEMLTEVTRGCRGQVVKTIGDEVMCLFSHAGDAARAAGEMQARMGSLIDMQDTSFGRLRLRVGLHYGEVLMDTGDIFGETVNIAARMVKLSKPDQILASEPAVRALPDEFRAMTRYVDEQTIVGRMDKLEVYEIIWEVAELTDVAVMPPPTSLRTVHTILKLDFGDRRITLGESRPVITIGRDEQSQLVVPTTLASRRHATIRLTRGRFVLEDRSVNGTFICQQDGREISLRRDDHTLDGCGRIGIGESPEDNPAFAIAFQCE